MSSELGTMMMLVYSLIGQNNSIRNEYNASTRDYSQSEYRAIWSASSDRVTAQS